MSDGAIVHDLQGHVLRVTFAREKKKNALTQEMYETLHASFVRASEDPDIRVMVLRGHPSVFCAGNDIRDFRDHPPESLDSPVGRVLVDLLTFEKPLLAAVAGPALGIGTTMLLHCDLVYATPDASFQFPFTRLGLCPEAGASVLLPLIAGYPRAAELLLFGEPFSAPTAKELRIINDIVDPEELDSRILERARALEALPPASVATTKRLLQRGRAALVQAAMERESAEFFDRLHSPEAQEAFAAFLEKRAPNFASRRDTTPPERS